jgi:hypothetical protein
MLTKVAARATSRSVAGERPLIERLDRGLELAQPLVDLVGQLGRILVLGAERIVLGLQRVARGLLLGADRHRRASRLDASKNLVVASDRRELEFDGS